MNRKVKSFKQTVFLSEHCAVSQDIASVRSAVFQPRHRPTIVVLVVYCAVEISAEIRSSGATSYCNHAAGSKPF